MSIHRVLIVCALSAFAFGCYGTSSQNLGQVARDNGLVNMTTGDGTFENYQATNYSTATEIGFGFGMPFMKMMEVFPALQNEALLSELAQDTLAHDGNAMIEVEPVSEVFYGFIFGVYIDSCAGTGIRTR